MALLECVICMQTAQTLVLLLVRVYEVAHKLPLEIRERWQRDTAYALV